MNTSAGKRGRTMPKRSDSPDVVFIVDGERIAAHRSILSACSPVLHAHFNNGMKETGEQEVTLQEMKASTWRLVLTFLYGKEITVFDELHCLEILQCANRFLLDHLESWLVKYLSSRISSSNVWLFTNAAYHISNLELKNEVLAFVGTHFSNSFVTARLPSLDLEVFEDVLQSPSLSYRGEFSIAYYVLEWLQLNPSRSGEDQARLLSHVQIRKMDEKDLKRIAHRCYGDNPNNSKPWIRDFQVSCMDQLLQEEFDFASSLPVPWDKRLVYSRKWETFSFKQRTPAGDIPVGKVRTSDGFEEPKLGCVYHLVLSDDTTHGKKVEVLSATWPKKYFVQIFVMDALEKQVEYSSLNSPTYVEKGTWWNLADGSGCIVVGATVYFYPEREAYPET